MAADKVVVVVVVVEHLHLVAGADKLVVVDQVVDFVDNQQTKSLIE